jgi:hypothetical protein
MNDDGPRPANQAEPVQLPSPPQRCRDKIAPPMYQPNGAAPTDGEFVEPTPYDPTILVFKHVPWITEPGIYEDMSDVDYHLDPVVGGSVSSSLLRKMIPSKGTAKHGLHYLTAEREEKGYFDLGSAFHTGVLGTGKTVVEVKAKSWQGAAAEAARRAAYARGDVPLLTKEIALAEAMVKATLADPECAELFTPGAFTAELVIVWEDPASGVMCRAKLDAIPNYVAHLRVVDVKTIAGDADPDSVCRFIERFGVHQQLAFYMSGVEALVALGLLAPVETISAFLVAVGKDAPHVPLARPVDSESIEIGRVQIRKALNVYAIAKATGVWPGYDDPKQTPVGLPHWSKTRFEYEHERLNIYDIEELW